MVQFPLVLAIEPKLLPYARANGFNMDRKVSPLTILYWLTFFRILDSALCLYFGVGSSSIAILCSGRCLRNQL